MEPLSSIANAWRPVRFDEARIERERSILSSPEPSTGRGTSDCAVRTTARKKRIGVQCHRLWKSKRKSWLSSFEQKQTEYARADADRAPVPLARPETHETVARILDPLPRGPLLDVPAGEGALSARLSKAGFYVKACDLHPEIFMLRDIEVRRGDLSGTLPYGDAEFQYITCLEGLEHIENPHQAIREFARLLAPGGHLVISVPNILNIEERVKWLLHGYTSHFKPISEEHLRMRHEQWGEKEEVALHINPIAYTELRYILEKYGFEVLGTYRDKPKPKIWLYWPLVAIVRLFSRLTSERKRRERWTAELASDELLLGGNTLVLHAQSS
jgi:2-polyprenyl-3-methyl-5-hydroxy-6-metoxy-1,4-benzoquinol methylase